MSLSSSGRTLLLPIFALMALAAAMPAACQDARPDKLLKPEPGMPHLLRMAEYLAKLDRFAVEFECSHDVVQPDGQKLEFIETRRVAVLRPSNLRVETTHSDGEKTLLVFDGKQIAGCSVTENVYMTVETTGTIDDAVRYATEHLKARVPLAVLLAGNLPEQLRERVKSAEVVEMTTVAGKECVHIAARGAEVDMQVWMRSGKAPLPVRIVLTYKKEKGMPQFRAQFGEWNTTQTFGPEQFAFTPPANAQRIDAPGQVQKDAAAKEEKK